MGELRRNLYGRTVAMLIAMGVSACSLNPQPLPPADNSAPAVANDAGKSGDNAAGTTSGDDSGPSNVLSDAAALVPSDASLKLDAEGGTDGATDAEAGALVADGGDAIEGDAGVVDATVLVDP